VIQTGQQPHHAIPRHVNCADEPRAPTVATLRRALIDQGFARRDAAAPAPNVDASPDQPIKESTMITSN
jgi:hypothetical protein